MKSRFTKRCSGLAVAAAFALSAETASLRAETTEARSLQLYAAGLCFALPGSASERTRSVGLGLPGYGVGFKTYNFIDPIDEGGFYWYIFGSSLMHQAGSVAIADSRPVGAGWRKTILGPLGVDLGAALVTGARIEGSTITASGFIGVGFSAGVYLDFFDAVDFGLIAEPVLMLWPRDGAFVAGRDYLDLSLFFALKSHYRAGKLPWRSAGDKES